MLAGAIRCYELGDLETTRATLLAMLEADPDWAQGYAALAQILWDSGEPEAFDTLLGTAIREGKGKFALATHCLRLLSDAGRFDMVLDLLPGVKSWAGEHLFFTLVEAIAATETDAMERADMLFARAVAQGGRLSVPHMQHLIKRGEAVRAAAIGEEMLRVEPGNQGVWGLLATAWRMTGDARHAWLVERPGLIQTIDLGFAPGALAELVTRLRKLHVAHAHPFDQSLRNGTQTTGNLFGRSDPEIVALCGLLRVAVRAYLDGLPPHDPGHPLLGLEREVFRFSDSWSVRLLDGGYHINHYHPKGSISSALYLTLPHGCDTDAQAGWLTLGEPPARLRTGLSPLRLIEPKVGRIAFFPSFLWHGTRPFPEGERMTVAFDTLLTR